MDKKLQDIADSLVVNGMALYHVRNRNEKRVAECMERLLAEVPDFAPTTIDIEDIYALSLNNLPPRYVQRGSIVLREPVRPDQVEQTVREAIETVRTRPNYEA
ncbi:hypothetical protein GGQ74_002469 [Desulfobaculum xiamenense]|uniref:Late competence development protein ComFB n=1 Tax=Desulfobaculum xiamenense TaxID=995050 RepID=A0A846QIU9_9BACT|nr:late competence development ComFB family protein [Desulfobaculum xiamenense]NJB68796.1 hypothetical protein [Desulfobaculum xiamenense]